MKIFAQHTSKYNPKGITVKVKTTQNGSWTEIHSGTAYNTGFEDTFVLDFDNTYEVYAIQLEVESSMGEGLILTEVEFYGPGEGTISMGSGSGAYTPGTPGYTKIPLSSSNLVGGCSDLNAARDANASTNFGGFIWYFRSDKGNLDRLQGLVDGVTNPPRSNNNKTGGYSSGVWIPMKAQTSC